MKSFGLWYSSSITDSEANICDHSISISKASEQPEPLDENKKKLEPRFCIHANFWSLEECPKNINKREPYLDIGIEVENWKQINVMTFFCPFRFKEKTDIIDLSEKMSRKANATIIFNEDCEIHTKGSYTTVEKEDGTKYLLFPLKQAIKNVYKQENDELCSSTYLRFDFKEFSKFLETSKQHSDLNEISKIYIRFRMKGDSLSHNIYFDSEPMNKSFESAFSGTRMIDFKINEKRNIEEEVRAQISVSHEKFAKLSKVHFLVMEPSAYEVRAFGNQDMNCRELEDGMWDDYFGDELNFSKGHILAYHWKSKADKDSYNCLVKVNYSKAKRATIISYALIVIALGIISSVIINWDNYLLSLILDSSLYSAILSTVVAAVLLFLGILLGKVS